MSKFILVYKSNEARDWSKLPEPEVKQLIQAWEEWAGSISAARKDGGAFKFGGKSATKDDAKDADNVLTGYAITEAKDFDEALSIAQKAPNVQADTGTIEIYEALGL